MEKKVINPYDVKLDPAEKALLIIYEQENQVFDDDGHRVSSIRKQKYKRVRLKGMSEDTDISILGENIVQKCGELIPDEWLPKVIELLGELQLASADAGEATRKSAAAATQAAARGEQLPEDSGNGHHAHEGPASTTSRRARPQSAARHGRSRAADAHGGSAPPASGSEQPPQQIGRAGDSSHGHSKAHRKTDPPPGPSATSTGGGSGKHAGSSRGGAGPASGSQTRGKDRDRDRSRPSSPKLQPLEDTGPQPLDLSPDAAAAADLAKHTSKVTRAEESTRIEKLEDYMEDLYEEDIDAKTQAALKVLSLARYSDHLGTIVDHDVLLDALARMAREEYKKNTELTTTLMEILYCISHYSDFHRALTSRRVGEVAMKVAELENQRYTARSRDLERQEQLYRLQKGGDAEAEAEFRRKDEELRVAFNEGREVSEAEGGDGADGGDGDEGAASNSGRKKKGKKGSKSGRSSSGKSSSGDKEGGRSRPKIKLKSLPKGRVDLSKERRRFALLTRRQERLLYYCFHVLLNLASDAYIEEKMVKRGIIGLLAPLLERPNPELLLLVVTFLRNLALVEEFSEAFLQHGDDVIRGLAAIVPCGHTVLAQSALRLLFALSFDVRMVRLMVAHSLVPRIARLLREKAYRQGSLRLMYHMSMDDPTKRLFTRTEATNIVIQLVTHYPKQQLPAELAGTAVNLTLDPAAAADLCRRELVAPLVKRATTTKDPSTVKILRNVSQYTLEVQCRAAEAAAAHRNREAKKSAYEGALAEGANAGEARAVAVQTEPDWSRESGMSYSYRLRHTWQPHVHALVRLLGTSSPDLLVEVFGLMSNLTPRDMPSATSWGDIAAMPRMMELLESNLAPGVTDDDILLEATQFVSAMALDKQGAKHLGKSHVPGLLAEVLGSKGEDPEIVNQACTAVYRLMHQKDARNVLLYETDACARLGAYLNSDHDILAANADDALCIALQYDRTDGRGDVWRRIQLDRFRAHNREWCDAVSRQAGPRGDPMVAASYINGDSEDDDSEAGMHGHGHGRGRGGQGYRLGRATHEMVAMDVGALEADADLARQRAIDAARGGGDGERFDGDGAGGVGGDEYGYYGGYGDGGDGAYDPHGDEGERVHGGHMYDDEEEGRGVGRGMGGPSSGAGAGGPIYHSAGARVHAGAGGRESYGDVAVGRGREGDGGVGGGMYWGSGGS